MAAHVILVAPGGPTVVKVGARSLVNLVNVTWVPVPPHLKEVVCVVVSVWLVHVTVSKPPRTLVNGLPLSTFFDLVPCGGLSAPFFGFSVPLAVAVHRVPF